MNLLEGHSQDAFETPTSVAPSDLSIPSTYVLCENDGAVPPFVQEMLSGGMNVERISAGHFPFLTKPQRVTDIIMQAAGV